MVVDGVFRCCMNCYGPVWDKDDSISEEDSILVEPHGDRLRKQVYLVCDCMANMSGL